MTDSGLPYFKTLRKGETLPPKYRTLKHFVPKQMENSESTDNFKETIESTKDFMMFTVYASLLLNLFAIGNLEYLVALIRCL